VCRWRVALGLDLMQIGTRLRTLCPSGLGAANGIRLPAVRWVCALVVLCMASPSAAAASRWAIQSLPANSGGLGAVSCTSRPACVAVGSVNKPGTELTLAARWNGARWSAQQTPSPMNGSSLFSGVSCTSRTACVAVGSCYCSGFHRPLAARWDGQEWSVQRTPHRAGVDTVLSAVSCTSGSACTAVGYGPVGPGMVGQQTVFVERFDGTGWSVETAPTPAWADDAFFNGVSCVSLTLCTAVGMSIGGPFDALTRPLVERWNGRRWMIQRTPRLVGRTSTELSGVSCSSSTACTAVGNADDGTLVERWSGNRWRIQPSPNDESAVSNTLSGVSCTSARVCIAVGATNLDVGGDDAPPLTSLAERWNGRHWSLQQTATQPGESWLNAVSCAAKNSCVAVGGSPGGGVVERYS
jgi:hypothetical protein